MDSERATRRVSALAVEIGKKGVEFWGTLRVESGNANSSTREVHAAECSEVVKALAVVAAIALGAEDTANTASNQPTDASNAGPADETTKPGVAPGQSTSATPPPAPVSNERRRLRGNSFRRERTIEVKAGTLHLDRVHDLSLSAGASFNLIPGMVLPRYELSWRFTQFMTPPGGSSRIVAPTLEVNWNFAGPVTRVDGGFETRAFGLGAGVRGCSALTYDSEGFNAHLCSEFGIVAMHFETRDAEGNVTQEKDTGIGIAGIGGELQYNLGRYFHVSMRAAGQVQIGGASAERPDGSNLFKVPLFGGYAVAGAGVHFW